MMNYVTKREYTGINADILSDAGVDAVVTFKQAIGLGIPGAKLKGLKACAKLVRFDSKKKTDDEEDTGYKRPVYFSVFDIEEVLARKVAA